MLIPDPASLPSSLPFAPATRAWFATAFAAATPVQVQAWAAIGQRRHTLVIAPTGSGKTLAAFLHAIDQLFATRDRQARDADAAAPAAATRVLYLSPIKALGADVQRNLQVPLQGVRAERARRGEPPVDLTVAIRSGDTPAAERARLARRPPDILITTPESLFLMLTSGARETLRQVQTVIIDEIHAVAGSKRGTHLALSLERLDALLAAPAQRIGLSATVRPVEEVARFLGGDRPVTVVNPPSARHLDVRIVVPVEDMADLAAPADAPGGQAGPGRVGSIWPHVEASILDQVLARRSTIVFANSRGVAEKLTARLNELYAGRIAGGAPPLPAPDAPEVPVHYGSFNGGTAGRTVGADALIARSHHGSVSKEQRHAIEQALKAGELRCVVATSSLELGIDMGLVDLVIQVAAPPSVASGLQRVGRAGHQVGGVSTGLVYPRTRRDLIDAAVAVEGMRAGRIEAVDPPRNPLDVLAQQTVAAVAMETLDVERWYATVRRAAPYRTLTRRAFDAVLDMLSGRYPSDDFAGFRPRLVWNRATGALSARPGARQLAVTSGGTIPDRGMFSVVLPEGEERAGSRRVGELDEEMVHESRVNDVITLGATSWRVEQITHDQVVVTPAPGRSARLPFWRGEGAGRPAELGEAIGAFLRAFDAAQPGHEAAERAAAAGLDRRGVANLLGLLAEQRQATGVLPTDRTLVVERCRDESGDWRVMLHSPYGRRVHDPWALAIAARIGERWHVDPAVVASEDGIMVGLPDADGRLPGADLFLFDPADLQRIVTGAVGGSALFAARFRECASRALLLPRRTPGRRSPLWQQRLRAGQLLEIAQRYPEFPILIEAARECLQDVYDLDALGALMQRLADGAVRMTEVTTEVPSPFAAALLFGYVAEFMYGTDVPLAERRASVLALDSGLLGDLLGQVDLGELLDPVIVRQVGDELQRRLPARRVRGKEGVADLLRELGPLSAAQVAARLADGADAEAHLAALAAERRALGVDLAGCTQWAAIEDAGRLRDALGVALPATVPRVFLDAVVDPLGELVARFARTHPPFSTAEAAAAFGLGVAVMEAALERLAGQGALLQGNFGVQRRRQAAGDAPVPSSALEGREWVDEAVFRRLRLRSLQAARQATRPVPGEAYARLLLERHGLLAESVGHAALGVPGSADGLMDGTDGLLRVVEQLAGVPLPVSVWENQVLPARVRDYSPAMLDAVMAAGTVVWVGHARLGDDDGLVSLHLQEFAAETLPVPGGGDRAALSALQRAILAVLDDGGAFFARPLAAAANGRLADTDSVDAGRCDASPDAFHAALWGLVWAGHVTTDVWAPLRALSGARAPPRPSAAGTSRRRRRALAGLQMMAGGADAGAPAAGPATFAAPDLAGRWSLLPRGPASDTVRAVALAEGLLDRHGVVTRGAAVAEGVAGGFPALQQVYRGMEDAGRVLRGRFVEGLGGAQFAERTLVDRLRGIAGVPVTGRAPVAVGLSAVDPANPYGTVLPWPAHRATQRPVRRPGAFVVIGDGRLLMYLAQGGRSLLLYGDGEDVQRPATLAAAAAALAAALKRGRRLSFTLELIDDAPVQRGAVTDALRAAGFRGAPRGLTWEG